MTTEEFSSADEARAAWQHEYDEQEHRDVDFQTMSGDPVEPIYGDPP